MSSWFGRLILRGRWCKLWCKSCSESRLLREMSGIVTVPWPFLRLLALWLGNEKERGHILDDDHPSNG